MQSPGPRCTKTAYAHRGVLVSAVLLLVACAQVSDLQRPTAPIPSSWPAGHSTTGHVDAARTHWRNFFPDRRLHALIAAALDNNRDLRIAAARVLEARAQYGIVRSDQSLQANIGGSANLTRTPSNLRADGTPAFGSRFDVSVSSVSFEIDFWGRLAKLSEAARASYLATEEAQRATHIALVADIATVYFTLLHFDELTTLTHTTLLLREQSLALIGKGRDIGGAHDYDYQQARSQVETTRANLASLAHQRTRAGNHLQYLVGQTLPGNLPPAGTLDQQGFESDVAPGLPAEVLLMRPDVLAAEQRLAATHANIGAARAAFLPKIALTAGLGLASHGLLGLFSGGAWSFLPSITMPLFDGGRTAASVDLAEARKVIAVAEYEKTIQLAFREVADLLSARESLVRQWHANNENLAAQERRLRIAQARYEAGLVSYLEVLDGQRELLAAQQNSTQVRRAQLETAAQLYKALGGGNDNAT